MLCFSLLAFLIYDTFLPVKENTSYSKVILDNNGDFLHAYLSNDDKWRLYTEVSEITPELIKSIRVKEDRFFYYHPGINPIAITRAVFNNIRKGYRTSGASTITMQVARLKQPKRRTIISKVQEMIFAFQLEWKYSKKEILQLYINLLPYGGNIEGIKSASLLYFNKFPQQLSIDEIALLSVIPNNPEKFKIGKDDEALLAKRDTLLKFLKKRKTFDAELIDDALNQKVNAKRRSFPKNAPHFSNYIKSKSVHYNIQTTLNAQAQSSIQSLAASYAKQIKYSNIRNISIIVINNQDRSVIAYLGSQNFNDKENAGQVDGTNALRSPGSTLKPLIYGLAFDKGYYTSKSIITDLPISYNGYQPENYDEQYRGKVTIEHSLANSLNIPAVKVLRKLEVSNLIQALYKANFKWIDSQKDNLGLSLALGGCSVTLQELTGLYAAFANNGKWLPLKFLDEDQSEDEKQIISEASSYMLYEILTQITRPDLPNEFANAKNLPKIAWKTGTSYGRRDAWSIGYNKNITVGVWVGNFSGEGVPELSGAEIATPLMINIFNAIDYDKSDAGFKMPKSLALRYVCKETGAVPNGFCEDHNQILDYNIPQVSSQVKCNHLKKVWVNSSKTESYCSYCLPDEDIIEVNYQNLPADLISYYESENIAHQKIPPHNPDCSHQFEDHPPIIAQPTEGTTYFIDKAANEKILLKADAHNDVKEIFWYVNDKLVGSCLKDDQLFVELPKGQVEITCTDDKGRASKVRVKVEFL